MAARKDTLSNDLYQQFHKLFRVHYVNYCALFPHLPAIYEYGFIVRVFPRNEKQHLRFGRMESVVVLIKANNSRVKSGELISELSIPD